jgi:FMN phosphatase YigB (HAD superfamily)
MKDTISDFFFDIDYTLLDFEPAHRQAIALLGQRHGERFAGEFIKIFQIILEGKRVKGNEWQTVPGGKSAFDDILHQIQALTQDDKPFMWSRELHAWLAGQRVEQPLTSSQCLEVAEQYWSGIMAFGQLYHDVPDLITELNRRAIRYHLFTSSDFRLQWVNGKWKYDPGYSTDKKMERVVHLQQLGINPASIMIGDPIDKPEILFYEKMLEQASHASGQAIQPEHCVVVGDSYAGDVQVPVEQLHFQSGYWLRRDGHSARISQNIFSINSLTEIADTIKKY